MIVIVPVPDVPSAMTLKVLSATPTTEKLRPVVVPSDTVPCPVIDTVIVSTAETPTAELLVTLIFPITVPAVNDPTVTESPTTLVKVGVAPACM